MEATEQSDWSEPSQFLDEIIRLRIYLLRIKFKKNYIDFAEIRDDCKKKLDKVINICKKKNDFINVFLFEFNRLSKEIITDIKSKSENYSLKIKSKDFISPLEKLLDSLNKNIYLIYKIEIVKSNEGSISSTSLVSTKAYIKIGEIMKESPKAVQIKQNLAELRSNGDGETSYYASIVGPSFLGKTQTAFTLSHHMIVFYVCGIILIIS